MRYDLHCHSTASDGLLAPAELAAHLAGCGVAVMALTDHDSTAGTGEAGRAAAALGLGFLAGVEVSVSWRGQVLHVLGLDVDPGAPELQRGLARLQAEREERGRRMGRRLERAGVPGAYEAARRLAGERPVGRGHFARGLVAKGYARDPQEAFRRFLRRGRPGYVAGRWAALEEAVAWIQGAGGEAVLAHPLRYGLSSGALERLVAAFREAGGAALEVHSGPTPAEEARRLARLAARHGLAGTVGSDYHGPGVSPGDPARLPEAWALPCEPLWARRGWAPPRAAAAGL